MLVLTRGLKQQIVIDGGIITVTVLDVRGGRVRLGIEAPAEVPVRRREVPADASSESRCVASANP
jgi:carbon storage regulator